MNIKVCRNCINFKRDSDFDVVGVCGRFDEENARNISDTCNYFSRNAWCIDIDSIEQCRNCYFYASHDEHEGVCLKRGNKSVAGYQSCRNYKRVEAEAEVAADEQNPNVNHPSHYTGGGVECIDAIRAALGDNFTHFCIGNVIKYCWRYKDKNGVEDLEKAKVYLDWAIEWESRDGN